MEEALMRKSRLLAVAAAAALHRNHGSGASYAFDRKEVKDHADKGLIVGRKLADGQRLVIVEDGGHFLPMDTPEEIAREINAFVG